MIQKEVLPRLTAHASQDGYGPLSILIAYLGHVKRQFVVSRGQFAPIPHVDSVVVTIDVNRFVCKLVKLRFIAFVNSCKTV